MDEALFEYYVDENDSYVEGNENNDPNILIDEYKIELKDEIARVKHVCEKSFSVNGYRYNLNQVRKHSNFCNILYLCSLIVIT